MGCRGSGEQGAAADQAASSGDRKVPVNTEVKGLSGEERVEDFADGGT